MRKILIFLICFCSLFLCFVIPSFADEGMTSRATPTDLTGYTVTVPSDWSASAGYGRFDIQFELLVPYSASYDDFSIGYRYNSSSNSFSPESSLCSFFSSVRDTGGSAAYSQTLSFNVLGGADAGNSSLIQWLVDNDAVFTSSTPETSSIAGGIYHFKTFGNLPDIPDASWSDGEGYTYSYTLAGKYVTTSRTISFTGINITFDEYVINSHYTVTFSVDTYDGVIDLATYSASYGQIELEIRADLKYLVFDEALIGSYNDIEFIRQFLVSGFPDTDSSATDNPWAYILEMIIEALKVDLFGYFSVWDIFTTICGIFIVTWLLKLLAGG